MPITLAMTDLVSSYQATATISGSDVATNTIKAYTPSTGLWADVGSRSGDGTATCTFTANGFYWVACHGTVSGSPEISNVLPLTITSTTTSIWDTILRAIAADMQTLVTAGYFPGLDDTADIQRYTDTKVMLNAMKGAGLPAIGIGPGDVETIKVPTSAQEDIGYPVMVVYRDVADPKQDDDETENESLRIIRERVRRRYISQRVPGFSRAQNCDCEPMASHQFESMGYNGIASAMVFRFTVRESRGVF